MADTKALLAEADDIAANDGNTPAYVREVIEGLATALREAEEQERAAARSELEARAIFEDALVSLRSLDYKRGEAATAAFDGDGAKWFRYLLGEMFYHDGGENYVELQFTHPKNGERFIVTTQRVNGKTPHDLKAEADARLARFEALAREVVERKKHYGYPLAHEAFDFCDRLAALAPEPGHD